MTPCRARFVLLFCAVAAFLGTSPAALAAPFFQGIGTLAGETISVAFGISRDGLAVVGESENPSDPEAVLWTLAGGLTGLGDLAGGGLGSSAEAASSSTPIIVVGRGTSGSGTEAFRWDGTSLNPLGDLAGGAFSSWAFGVSDDGSVVVGRGTSGSGIEAFRWESSVMTGLGDLPGGAFTSFASAVSSDGSVVVGAGTSASGTEAFRWESSVMTGLGDLPGGTFSSRASAVSADGLVIVGDSNSANGMEAFRWTSGGGMVGLGDLPGGSFDSVARGVSADGSVIVGRANFSSTPPIDSDVFIWDEQNGMRELRPLLVACGLDLSGWSLGDAFGVSDDGRRVAGIGTHLGNIEGWVAEICDPPGLPTLHPALSVLLAGALVVSGLALARGRRLRA